MREVLFADDDAAMREMVSDVLRAGGYAVRLAFDGAAALREIQRAHPDLAILDHRMGIPDGFDVCRTVKGDPRSEHVPILILTADQHVDHRVRAFDSGADDFLAKPFDPRELLARCAALLRLARQGLDRNPTSGLPGGEAVRRELELRFQRGEPFSLCYFDLDNFKPFHDHFGFVAADEAIRAAARALREGAEPTGSFVGHVGGDDFVLIAPPSAAGFEVPRVQASFRAALAAHLPAEVVARGRYSGQDRDGADREFPLTRLSAGVLTIDAARAVSLDDLGPVIARLKLAAKRSPSGIAEATYPPPG